MQLTEQTTVEEFLEQFHKANLIEKAELLRDVLRTPLSKQAGSHPDVVEWIQPRQEWLSCYYNYDKRRTRTA